MTDTNLNLKTITSLLVDYQTTDIERVEHSGGSVSYLISLESPSNGDILSAQIALPAEVMDQYDFRIWDNKSTWRDIAENDME